MSLLPKGEVFVVFCFILRVVMAFGGAAADTASFAIVAGEFGAKIGVVTVSYKYKTTDMQQYSNNILDTFISFCCLCVSAFSFNGGQYTQTTPGMHCPNSVVSKFARNSGQGSCLFVFCASIFHLLGSNGDIYWSWFHVRTTSWRSSLFCEL